MNRIFNSPGSLPRVCSDNGRAKAWKKRHSETFFENYLLYFLNVFFGGSDSLGWTLERLKLIKKKGKYFQVAVTLLLYAWLVLFCTKKSFSFSVTFNVFFLLRSVYAILFFKALNGGARSVPVSSLLDSGIWLFFATKHYLSPLSSMRHLNQIIIKLVLILELITCWEKAAVNVDYSIKQIEFRLENYKWNFRSANYVKQFSSKLKRDLSLYHFLDQGQFATYQPALPQWHVWMILEPC